MLFYSGLGQLAVRVAERTMKYQKKSKWANFMKFSPRVSSFFHQLTALWVLMDSRMVIY